MLTVLWQTKSTVRFPLEDKHVVNEHKVVRRNVLTWCISTNHVTGLKQTRGIKNVTSKAAKKSWVSRSIDTNRPFPSFLVPLFQNESKCENEFCMQFHFHANQSHFHKNGFALRLALKQSHKGTQKWPIRIN